ncbi:hypothetical protein [Streptococcus parasuis]|uniref:hypothetical protein n=1 Tax=Streptococcus parasuis TaxID=1501662 RepID=UPI0028B049DB|nr:hypothetical protein [Streptococcus parasuis]
MEKANIFLFTSDFNEGWGAVLNGLKENSLTVITDNSLKSSEEYFRELLLHVGDVSVCTKLFEKSILENLFFDERKIMKIFCL